jgi:transcriptional regulator with XRE-family HTH domain
MRFKECRIISGVSISEIARKLSIDSEEYMLIEEGNKVPDIRIIREFCSLVNISSNYLLEIIDEPLPIMLSKELITKRH